MSRNIIICGKRTSVRLERHMWQSLKEIAEREKLSINELATHIYLRVSSDVTFTASLRTFIMLYYKAAATETGHVKVGHGNLKSKLHRFPIHPDKKLLSLSSDSYKDN